MGRPDEHYCSCGASVRAYRDQAHRWEQACLEANDREAYESGRAAAKQIQLVELQAELDNVLKELDSMNNNYQSLLKIHNEHKRTSHINNVINKIHNTIVEQCAQICDDKHYDWRFGDDNSSSGPKECAESIRSLKIKEDNELSI